MRDSQLIGIGYSENIPVTFNQKPEVSRRKHMNKGGRSNFGRGADAGFSNSWSFLVLPEEDQGGQWG